jgi:hypothetical protein
MSYPANRARIEYAAGDLLDVQAAQTAAFHTIVTSARIAIAALEFPLGSPSAHYDISDIDGTLGDWLITPNEGRLEEAAFELATNAEADGLAGVAEYRADLRREEGWRGLSA